MTPTRAGTWARAPTNPRHRTFTKPAPAIGAGFVVPSRRTLAPTPSRKSTWLKKSRAVRSFFNHLGFHRSDSKFGAFGLARAYSMCMESPRARLHLLAAGQDGQFATAQALSVGLTRHDIAGMRQRGEAQLLRRGVSRFCSAAGEPDVAVTAALTCWPDAVVSHRSAAQHHGIRRVKPHECPEITVPHGQVRKLPGIKVHWSRDMPSDDILRVGGVGYMSLARTTIDLSDPADPWEALAVLDDVVAMGAKRPWIHRRAKAMANGRGGVTLIRDATAPGAASEFRSWLERAAAYLYRAGGLPDPEWNVRVRDAAGTIGVVDALWPQWRVVSEKEGLRFHTSPAQRRKDAERFNRLQDADYRPRRFTWEDVVTRPVHVVESLHRALRAAGADLDPLQVPQQIVIPTRPFVL